MTVVTSLFSNTEFLPTVSLIDGTGSKSMLLLEAGVELEPTNHLINTNAVKYWKVLGWVYESLYIHVANKPNKINSFQL